MSDSGIERDESLSSLASGGSPPAGAQPEAGASGAPAQGGETAEATTSYAPVDSNGSKTPQAVDLTDRRLGEFRILRRLGTGGMAEVYLALQTSLHRHVALKVLRPELLSEQGHVERFQREAKAAGGLNHPNIVQVYMIGRQDGTHYIAQEYVQGFTLSEYVRRNGPPDAAAAVGIMRQVAAALEAAGEAGIVHRDIKPENIMITRRGQAKVTDFGLAQLSRPTEGLNLTQDGMTMGTPLYMSPEQVGGSKLDQRSDIYSFGVTCYHMLAGRPPFRGETAFSVALGHLNESPQPLHEQRRDLPRELCDLVHRMMAKRPEDRLPDARSVLVGLERVAKSLAEQGGELSIDLWNWPPVDRQQAGVPIFGRSWSPGRLALLLAVACVLTAGVAALAGWWMRPDDPRASSAQAVARKPTIQEQFELAESLGDDEDAWLAVIDFEPTNRELQMKARERLALLYLRQLRYEEAGRLFEELALQDEEATRVRGLAGIAVVAALQGDHRRSQQIIDSRLSPPDEHIDPTGELGFLLMQAEQRNRAAGVEDGNAADPTADP